MADRPEIPYNPISLGDFFREKVAEYEDEFYYDKEFLRDLVDNVFIALVRSLSERSKGLAADNMADLQLLVTAYDEYVTKGMGVYED